MEHTNGPWNVQRNVTNYRSGRKSLEIRGASDELIATFPGCERDSSNARLIAAAPELLSFVQEWLDRQGTDENYMTEKARSIIAKATNV